MIWLHEALTAPAFHLLLCGPGEPWDDAAVADLQERHAPYLTVHRIGPRGDLVDVPGAALHRLGVRHSTCLVVRPDGHIGHRADDAGLDGAADYLRRWLPQNAGSRQP